MSRPYVGAAGLVIGAGGAIGPLEIPGGVVVVGGNLELDISAGLQRILPKSAV